MNVSEETCPFSSLSVAVTVIKHPHELFPCIAKMGWA